MMTFAEKLGELGLQQHEETFFAYLQDAASAAQLQTISELCESHPALIDLLEKARTEMFNVLLEKRF